MSICHVVVYFLSKEDIQSRSFHQTVVQRLSLWALTLQKFERHHPSETTFYRYPYSGIPSGIQKIQTNEYTQCKHAADSMQQVISQVSPECAECAFKNSTLPCTIKADPSTPTCTDPPSPGDQTKEPHSNRDNSNTAVICGNTAVTGTMLPYTRWAS